MATVRIPLHSRKYPGLYALVDEEDVDLVQRFTWCPHVDGASPVYAVSRGGGRMHRLIMDAKPGEIVDHINRDALDNRRSNLRIVNATQSTVNTSPKRGTSSRFKGVTPERGRWRAQIHHHKRPIWLGVFDTEEEAARVYDVAARSIFGDCAYLNFPDDPPASTQCILQVDPAYSSKFRGVFWKKEMRKWCAMIGSNGKRVHLGYFGDEIEAALAYDEAAKEMRGDKAILNFRD